MKSAFRLLALTLLAVAGGGGACLLPYTPTPSMPAGPMASLDVGRTAAQLTGGMHGGHLAVAHKISAPFALRLHGQFNTAAHNTFVSAGVGAGYAQRLTTEFPLHVGAALDGFFGKSWGPGIDTLGARAVFDLSAVWPNGSTTLVLPFVYTRAIQSHINAEQTWYGNALWLEPGLRLAVGSDPFRLVSHLGVSYPLYQQGELGSAWPFLIGVGIQYVH